MLDEVLTPTLSGDKKRGQICEELSADECSGNGFEADFNFVVANEANGLWDGSEEIERRLAGDGRRQLTSRQKVYGEMSDRCR